MPFVLRTELVSVRERHVAPGTLDTVDRSKTQCSTDDATNENRTIGRRHSRA